MMGAQSKLVMCFSFARVASRLATIRRCDAFRFALDSPEESLRGFASLVRELECARRLAAECWQLGTLSPGEVACFLEQTLAMTAPDEGMN
jgi:hypothetical protein